MSPAPLEALTRAAYYDGDAIVTKDVPRCQWWLGDRQCRALARRDDPLLHCGVHRRPRVAIPVPEPVTAAPPAAVDPVAGAPPAVIDATAEAVYAHARALHRLAEALDRVALALGRAGGETGH